MPTLYVVAGPNGCGKSTLVRTTWFYNFEKIDPDDIARIMKTGNVLQAGREALLRRRSALELERTHLVETTLSGAGVLRHVQAAREKDYKIVLHYISLDSPEEALDRIRNRVRCGGHNVPKVDVKRRFVRSHSNLPTMIALSDEGYLYDNSKPDDPHRTVANFRQGSWRINRNIPDWVVQGINRFALLRATHGQLS
ncbi:MAG: ATPase [Gammaproteobacteria bacterium]|nr:ATPase [Gammaproteobacteria bacterium]MYJ52357.1 ATPase [Gammaproteobacteria bacterium]